MGTVHVVIADFGRVIDKVPSVSITYETIVVIVITFHTVSLHLVSPNVVFQVRVSDINTSIKNSNNRTLAINDRLVPQLLDTIGVQSPLLCDIGVIAIAVSYMLFCHDVHFVVRLGKLDFLKGCQAFH